MKAKVNIWMEAPFNAVKILPVKTINLSPKWLQLLPFFREWFCCCSFIVYFAPNGGWSFVFGTCFAYST